MKLLTFIILSMCIAYFIIGGFSYPSPQKYKYPEVTDEEVEQDEPVEEVEITDPRCISTTNVFVSEHQCGEYCLLRGYPKNRGKCEDWLSKEGVSMKKCDCMKESECTYNIGGYDYITIKKAECPKTCEEYGFKDRGSCIMKTTAGDEPNQTYQCDCELPTDYYP